MHFSVGSSDNVPYQVGMILEVRKALDSQTSLSNGFSLIEPILLQLFNAERLSIFQRRSHHHELIAVLKSGPETKEIKLQMNLQSIAGYVSVSQRPVIVSDPYNDDVIRNIHPRLEFNSSFDEISDFRTSNLLCVPIVKSGVLLGVLEFINKQEGDFTESDLALAVDVAKLLGKKYHHEIGGTKEPLEYLVHQGYLTAEELNTLKQRSLSFADTVNELVDGLEISENDVGQSLSMFYQVPYISFKPQEYFLSGLQKGLSDSYASRNQVVVITDRTNTQIILVGQPTNAELLLEVQSVLGLDECEIAVGLPRHIEQYLSLESSVEEPVKKEAPPASTNRLFQKNTQQEQTVQVEATPINIKFVAELLEDAYKQGVSDIHIEPDVDGPTLVRYRIDGDCRDVNRIPQKQHDGVAARIKILANLNVAEKRLPQDGKLVFNAGSKKVEFRVATVPSVAGEAIVLRLLSSSKAVNISQLALASSVHKRLNSIIYKPHGIFLVVGPTGSGKTTTLHAILGLLNVPEKSIWAAEDPVEITQSRIQQVQVNPKIGYTFATALRSFLRSDPDIILIGEMRDKETAQAAIEASNTGHLVLSTLHTNSATESITRLMDMGIDAVNFADACQGILAQRLIKVLCKKCKKRVKLTNSDRDTIINMYGKSLAHELQLDKVKFVYEAVGCPQCGGTGYRGRMGVHELLVMTDGLRRLVLSKASLSDLVEQATEDGLRFLIQDALLKHVAGHTDMKQVRMLAGVTQS